MKKRLCVLLALVCVLAAGCGKQDTPPAADVDLQAAYDEAYATIESDNVVLFPESDPAMIEGTYPGLGAIECKQTVIALPPVMGASCEVAMVEVANAADAETVRDIFQTRVDSLANDTAYPENAAGWKNGAHVTVNGNIVILAVLPEGVEMPAAFLGEF